MIAVGINESRRATNRYDPAGRLKLLLSLLAAVCQGLNLGGIPKLVNS